MLYRLTTFAGFAAAAAHSSITIPERALAGAAFPPPSDWHSGNHLETTIQEFQNLIANSSNVQMNATAWAVAVFTTSGPDSNATLYEKYFTPDYDVGVEKVNRDSVFRIASISKVFSVWSILMEVGDEHFNDPITKYVPELANVSSTLSKKGDVYDDIDVVRWDEVTLGQLASHLAGISRDVGNNDLEEMLSPEALAGLGFPKLDPTNATACGRPEGGCNRKGNVNDIRSRRAALTSTVADMINQLLRQHPIFSTAHAPAYTNVGYALLGFAQEAITGQSARQAITDNILSALNMSSSAFAYEDLPKSTAGVIPGGSKNASTVSWDDNLGSVSPAGSMYSSAGDMIKVGRAILGSKLLTPARTRRWLKPLSATGVLSSAVGAPWEIRYLPVLDQRIVQLYTKQGDIGGYHAALVLSPEHNLGAVILTAGMADGPAPAVREDLMNAVGQVFLPAAEEQARYEAKKNFAGIYEDSETNSTAIIQVEKGVPGLKMTKFVSRDQEILGLNSPFIDLFGAGQNARIFPSNLRTISKRKSGKGDFTSRLGFRATFFNATEEGHVMDPGLQQWAALGAPAYGSVSLDEWVFEMGEDGQAEVLDARMMRLKLKRTERKTIG